MTAPVVVGWVDGEELRAALLRDRSLDAFRGLAVLLMIGDHLSLIFGLDGYRMTLGRLAMPMFFLLAGQLAGRLHWRHARIAGIGLVLPLVVPWIDAPNVLVLWALGCVLLWAGRQWFNWSWPLLVVVVGLSVAANGWGEVQGAYAPLALWGLMGAGALAPRSWFTWAGWAPGWVAFIGRHPVAWYVGHLLVLEGVVLWLLSV